MHPSKNLLAITLSKRLTKPITTTLITSSSRHTTKMSATGIPSGNTPQTPQQPTPGSGPPASNEFSTISTPTAAATGTAKDVANKSTYQIESTDFQTSSGVELGEKERLIVGSVLDLFAGKPTLKKLSLWTDDATFKDPLCNAAGRKQYSAQWYGLAAAFSEIITSTGNPITLDLKSRYKVKGLGTEKVIESTVKIFTDDSGEKITGVEDRWNGSLPEGPIAKVFRNLNAITVPVFVSVPKTETEEASKKD